MLVGCVSSARNHAAWQVSPAVLSWHCEKAHRHGDGLFLQRAVRWEERGDHHVGKTDTLGSLLAMYSVWPHLIDEDAEAPGASGTCPASPCWPAAAPELDLPPSRPVTAPM